jgi:serine/threonine protein kinase
LSVEQQNNNNNNNSSSSCVLKFLGASFSEGRVTIGLELMNRGSLETLVRKHGSLAPPNRHSLLRRIALGMTQALSILHSRHQVHRDIKAANALLSLQRDKTIAVKLSDFGLLRQLTESQAFSSTFVGTLIYLSPERIVGDSYGTPSDIWSLGITMLYLIQGGKLDLPSDFFLLLSKVNKNPPLLDAKLYEPNLPSDLCDFVNSCLVVNAESRATAEQLLQHPYLQPHNNNNSTNNNINTNSSTEEPIDSALSALIEPPAEELSLLANAVISRYYRLQLQSPNPFTSTSVDESRFTNLAQQLGCDVSCIRDAIVSRLNRHLQQPQQQQQQQQNYQLALQTRQTSNDESSVAPLVVPVEMTRAHSVEPAQLQLPAAPRHLEPLLPQFYNAMQQQQRSRQKLNPIQQVSNEASPAQHRNDATPNTPSSLFNPPPTNQSSDKPSFEHPMFAHSTGTSPLHPSDHKDDLGLGTEYQPNTTSLGEASILDCLTGTNDSADHRVNDSLNTSKTSLDATLFSNDMTTGSSDINSTGLSRQTASPHQEDDFEMKIVG